MESEHQQLSKEARIAARRQRVINKKQFKGKRQLAGCTVDYIHMQAAKFLFCAYSVCVCIPDARPFQWRSANGGRAHCRTEEIQTANHAESTKVYGSQGE